MKPAAHRRMQSQDARRKQSRTHYLWRNKGESLEDVRKRFQAMIAKGRASENGDYIIFRWQW